MRDGSVSTNNAGIAICFYLTQEVVENHRKIPWVGSAIFEKTVIVLREKAKPAIGALVTQCSLVGCLNFFGAICERHFLAVAEGSRKGKCIVIYLGGCLLAVVATGALFRETFF